MTELQTEFVLLLVIVIEIKNVEHEHDYDHEHEFISILRRAQRLYRGLLPL